jgi:hypothetical protein
MAFPQTTRSLLTLAAFTGLAACSSVDHAIIATENGASRMFAGSANEPPPPAIDAKTLSWQKLGASSAVQFAMVGGTTTQAGATQVALRVPAGETIPAFWQEVPESYTVVSGTFVVEGIDAKGLPQHTVQGPGASARVPARMIQHVSSTSAGDGMLLLTVFGDWKPNFVDGTPTEIRRAAAN